MKFFASLFVLCMAITNIGCYNKTPDQPKPEKKIQSEDLDMDGMEQAMEQEFKMTHDPSTNTIPSERLMVAQAQMKSIMSRELHIASLSWAERGPNNIGGRTRAILVDKSDPSGNTVFAGSVSGGIFKSTNFTTAGASWSPVNDQMTNLAITALVQSSSSPNIMYAGTGEGWFNIDGLRGAGIFKSVNGGTTWTQLASTASYEYVQDLAIDNNGNIYCSLRNSTTLNRGVMRSTDGGNSWTQVLGAPLPGFATGRAADLEVASNGDIYATLGIFSRSQVMKSSFATNGANTGAVGTWIEITPVHTAITQRAELAVAPSNPLRLYLMTQDSANFQVKTLYRSSDAGVTWDSLPAPAALNNGTVSQNWYNLIAAVDPSNADVVIVGGFHLAKSTDAGNNFLDITTAGVHVDQHTLVYISSSQLIAGNDGGIYYSTDANNTTPSYANKNNGFNVTQFYGADYHPTSTNYFLAGAQDNNTQKFLSSGINSTVPVVGGDGGVPHIDQTDPSVQIASTTGNNFYRSTDGGNNFSFLSSVSNSRGQFINGSDYDDVGNTLYSGDNAGQYFYINNLTGTPVAGTNVIASIGSSREVTAVKVDPFTPNTVWLGTNSTAAGVQPVILKISNANTSSPQLQGTAIINVPAGSYISCVDVDPSNANHLLATLSNYGITSVFESTDGGSSFNSIEGNLPDMPVYWGIFAPNNVQLNGATGGNGGILLGTELGVWTTSAINGTSTNWIPNNNGFPNVRTDMIKWRFPDYFAVAATHGRGLFTTSLPFVSFPTGVSSVSNTKNFIKSTIISPQQLYITIGNLAVTRMQVKIFDMNGRLVFSNDAKYVNQNVSINQLAAGSYVLKIWGNKNEQYTLQFVK